MFFSILNVVVGILIVALGGYLSINKKTAGKIVIGFGVVAIMSGFIQIWLSIAKFI